MHRYRTAGAPGAKELSRLNINCCWVSIDLSEVLTWDSVCIQMSQISGVICSKYTSHLSFFGDLGVSRNAGLFPKVTRFVQKEAFRLLTASRGRHRLPYSDGKGSLDFVHPKCLCSIAGSGNRAILHPFSASLERTRI